MNIWSFRRSNEVQDLKKFYKKLSNLIGILTYLVLVHYTHSHIIWLAFNLRELECGLL